MGVLDKFLDVMKLNPDDDDDFYDDDFLDDEEDEEPVRKSVFRKKSDDDERISGIKRGDLVKYKDSYYVYNAGDGPEGTWAPNPNTGSNVWYKIPK